MSNHLLQRTYFADRAELECMALIKEEFEKLGFKKVKTKKSHFMKMNAGSFLYGLISYTEIGVFLLPFKRINRLSNNASARVHFSKAENNKTKIDFYIYFDNALFDPAFTNEVDALLSKLFLER